MTSGGAWVAVTAQRTGLPFPDEVSSPEVTIRWCGVLARLCPRRNYPFEDELFRDKGRVTVTLGYFRPLTVLTELVRS